MCTHTKHRRRTVLLSRVEQAGRAKVSEKARERAEKVYIAADVEESAGVIKSYVGVARHQQTTPAGAAVESSEKLFTITKPIEGRINRRATNTGNAPASVETRRADGWICRG